MKLIKAERTAIIITAAFILLSIGYYYGLAHTKSDYYVTVEKQADDDAIMQGGDSFAPSASPVGITEKININEASSDELAELPGIGDVLAVRIIAYREENGEFKNIESIMDVDGIGEGTFTKIKGMITV